MPELFGTDGIRGEVNKKPLTPDLVLNIGRALGIYWSRNSSQQLVTVGHDGRLSADYLQNLLCAGLQSTGLRTARIGLCTTPALAFVTRMRDTAGGIMISASHNPFFDNGIKPFAPTGVKFTPAQEEEVESILKSESFDVSYRDNLGNGQRNSNWLSEYVDVLSKRSVFYPGRILLDCANGGASELAPSVLEEMCNAVICENCSPDGTNINRRCGSLNVDRLRSEVRERDVDLGFALDGDADRLLAVDEKGNVVNGDVLIYMLAVSQLSLAENPGGVVITVMSNLGLRRRLEESGIDYQVVGVGDREVYRRLVDQRWQIGGEQSGHVIDREWLPTGDGLHTLVSVLDVLSRENDELHDWNSEVERYPQVLNNFEVHEKPPLEELDKSREKIAAVESELGRDGRVLVRYSGTEPVVRVMLEGKDEQQLEDYAAEIGNCITEEICEQAG